MHFEKNTYTVTVDILGIHFCAEKLKGIHTALVGNYCSRQNTKYNDTEHVQKLQHFSMK